MKYPFQPPSYPKYHTDGSDKNSDLQYHSIFGLAGYSQTKQDMLEMKVVLGEQM